MMWSFGWTARAGLKTPSRVKLCRKRAEWKGVYGRKQGLCTSSSCSPRTAPWRLMFFGTDQFALESLKLLSSSRKSSEALVETLEVVTLSQDVPVKRFAQQNHLPLHNWPPVIAEGQFDVGVIVSFGCLLHQRIINKFPYGILNVHPSLLPRWRGPAPVFHTILHGDTVTGVTIIQIRPHKFDVGPILNQELYQVPENSTADELGAALAVKGAHLLIDTLRKLPERIEVKREQGHAGATFAPKINTNMSWVFWEEQTCNQVTRLYRAIGSRIPLRTTWRGRTVKLLDFVGKYHVSDQRHQTPGSVFYDKGSCTLAICCKDGWVGFKAVLLNKRLTAADFYNGYLHQTFQKNSPSWTAEERFVSPKEENKELHKSEKSLRCRNTFHT
ncbi:methionyl-tRNA formyltransferase, mitochondrial isoform X1 [Nothobranchius furzeri]|uniref:Methionyl-tRNA formyltransferase, mitochondrial n=3 Tax=Nothobranchius TaxID=28779 RepID=A0A1A8AKG5_NOTFU|nr:transcript variant X1 [Nothobranchius furzeri]